jgi:ABC-type phosphate transport system substrate-binding protein
VITLLENEEIDLVPVESFGFVIEEKNNLEIISFLKWVLFNGQKYNNELGFLKLDDKTFASQKNRVEDNKLLSTLN